MTDGADAKFGVPIFGAPVADAIGRMSPTMNRWFLDPGSMLDPRMFGSASASVDKAASIEKSMLSDAKDYADLVAKLPQDQMDNFPGGKGEKIESKLRSQAEPSKLHWEKIRKTELQTVKKPWGW